MQQKATGHRQTTPARAARGGHRHGVTTTQQPCVHPPSTHRMQACPVGGGIHCLCTGESMPYPLSVPPGDVPPVGADYVRICAHGHGEHIRRCGKRYMEGSVRRCGYENMYLVSADADAWELPTLSACADRGGTPNKQNSLTIQQTRETRHHYAIPLRE